ncbi:MocR-like pyridoxine biosynthesis transcription factor PdxR [Sphingosinicella rhizophila]|uniref:PLP-dependent aminotransferase family protein n=1 Tax=Sphingosinicella rhizophila TaxID=3050082 RepID=A0ABU3Q6C4_9SPHN|nr:PLP-dependent aminotransferase family protein [Sphingosinicella sp. GR2756]MDT9598872.1 PLP-dependent aminotransferase family protein [Sphingosinicella sp. GR2756]
MELHVPIDRSSGATLPHQIGRALIEMICSGMLPPGTRLPASRAFADQLGVARLTVVEAYQWLADQGFVAARRGSRAVVQEVGILPSACAAPAEEAAAVPEKSSPAFLIDFRAVRPDLRAFPRRRWGAALAAASRDLAPEDLDYGDPLGHMPLREALSSYLRRSRGLTVPARNIVVTSGSGQSLDVMLRALPEHREVALEMPGHAIILKLMALHGSRMIQTPVDRDGIRADLLPADSRSKRIVLVTPSHQFPIGARMSLARRRALIAWASRTDALIFEDDYDSEFAYDGRPLIPLASIDRTGRVVYMGTFSKTLVPGLRLGFMVVPDWLRDRVAAVKLWCDYGGGIVPQAALARWIDDGSFERHLQRMRSRYRERYRGLVAEVGSVFGDRARIIGAPVGMHAAIALKSTRTAEEIADRAAGLGVGLAPLAPAAGMLEAGESAFLIGFGNLNEDEIMRGLALFAEAAA